ncbi:MAG: tRNA (adenosine(37)-N6)-threonylcarbamoyltransferase complex ATPase subunit type 1 TsaE [Lactobacillales bacterium]|jgi:tRNA threonylcarbamoyladenosine biosynthesis protein TsaE|nr:tRNA (adenosine(37)-N6)-threonylcarbamoyltransferase complex ATPase subunit type 1 TsaE [Lactobacillales bacterium]
MNEIKLNGLEDTEKLGRIIGEVATASDVILLTGDLGAGKTTLTKGIALGLGIEQMVKSPTYTIVREYTTGRIPLYHMDVYRVESGADELGLDEYFEGDGLSVVEWGRMLGEELPDSYLELFIKKGLDDSERTVQFSVIGDSGKAFETRILSKRGNSNE